MSIKERIGWDRSKWYLFVRLVVAVLGVVGVMACGGSGHSGEDTDGGVGGQDGGQDGGLGDAGEVDTCQLLEEGLQDVVESYLVRGLVVGVETPECGRWFLAMGEAKPGEDLLLEGRLRIASVTKTYTAATVLQLVGQIEVSLDDPIDKFVTGAPNGKLITIRHLLNHTSGLFDIVDDSTFMQKAIEDPTAPFTPEELLEVAFSHDPVFDPGSKASYCNTNFHVLGVIIQEVTGKEVSEAIQGQVLEPLSLQETVLEGEPPMSGEIVPGFSETGVNVTDVLHPSIRWTAGAMVTSIGELLHWTRALYGGELLGESEQEVMVGEPVVFGEVRLGLGVIIRDVDGVGKVWGHGGSAPGYRASIVYVPGFDSSVAVMANDAGTDAVGVSDALARVISEVVHDG